MEIKKKVILYLFITMAVGYYRTESREPVLHRVGGGRNTWAPKINFTEWASHEHFYKGDWLYFGFDKHIYNVLEVNKTSYENCIDTSFINNITRGGRDVFQLAEEKSYYFLSGKGFCLKGMRVAIDIEKPQSTQPSVLNEAFPLRRTSHTNIFVLFVLALAWIST